MTRATCPPLSARAPSCASWRGSTAVATATRSPPASRSRVRVRWRRGVLAGAVLTLALVGASLLVSLLEQVRERRRLLATLAAFGTRRATLGWSVLWQSAVPVALGLLLAIAAGG